MAVVIAGMGASSGLRCEREESAIHLAQDRTTGVCLRLVVLPLVGGDTCRRCRSAILVAGCSADRDEAVLGG